MSNAFETFAEVTKPAFQARRERTAAKAAVTRAASLERKQKEDATVRKYANYLRRTELETILAGEHGAAVADLRRVLRQLTIASAPDLVRYIEGSADLLAAPIEVRQVALGLVGRAIARVRIKEGLSPFDDGLPGDEPRAYHVIKAIMGVR